MGGSSIECLMVGGFILIFGLVVAAVRSGRREAAANKARQPQPIDELEALFGDNAPDVVREFDQLPRTPPRPPGAASPQVVYVPVYVNAKEKRRSSSPAAVGCLLLIIIGAVLLWPQIAEAFERVQAERSGGSIGAGILEITDVRYGVTSGTTNSFAVVTANVLPSAMNEATARLIRQGVLEDRPALHTFGAVLSDGERIFVYGYDLTTNRWSMTDMTGRAEP